MTDRDKRVNRMLVRYKSSAAFEKESKYEETGRVNIAQHFERDESIQHVSAGDSDGDTRFDRSKLN